MPPKNDRNSRSKYWCFTLNQPTIAEEEALKACARSDVASYFIYGRERGESGTYHFQGYVEFVNRVRLTAVKKIPGFNRSHLEQRRGSGKEASEYCKKDGDFVEFGTPTANTQGRRNDLESIKQRLDDGASSRDISDEFFSRWVVYRRSFEAYTELRNEPRHRPGLKVIVLRGESGTGKSSYVFSRHPGCWISTNPILRWFDGYSGQTVACIDDFNGETPFRFLLRLLDIYPIRVEIKGGHVAWNPETIFITTNRPITEWYGGEKDVTPIIRRVTYEVVMDELENSEISDKHTEIDEILSSL